MRKKLLSVILTVAVIFSFSTVSFAQGDMAKSSSSINRDTVITKDNVNEILKMFGLDPSTFKQSDTPKEKAALTVGQLEDAIRTINEQLNDSAVNEKTNSGYSSESKISVVKQKVDSSYISEPKVESALSASSTPVIGTVRLSKTTSPTSSYDLKYSTNASFARMDTTPVYKVYTGTNSPNVLLFDKAAPGNKNVLTSVNSVSSTNTSDMVTLNAQVVVSYYLVIGVEGTELSIEKLMSTNTITAKQTWDTSYIPNQF
ncbi:hypothetical protein [Ruminiclostridium cellulolyticum]|uniref:Uncharacterized protein n=1 Tax=Ruminiclostridium cellulolyticum (strain ATCC 35319 / DSM 5812 / JCM 6584 / H10) TaxID=394503 RepID=B8I8H9_RUMCH|nr:hypothetical protein [Ruminiclostridium cellulolyticum]ACL75212.1 hypothetical protein Ccel_0835 [Ruminiclostridium cellulolyticum H10]